MKTKPFAHQLDEFELSRDAFVRALWWEMGTGKSKVIIDTAEHLYCTGKIRGMLVIAPDSVQQNWLTDEIPAHLDDGISRTTFLWESKRSTTKRFMLAFEEFMEAEDLAILAMSYDAFMTTRGAKAALSFMKRPVLYVLDESTRIKTPSAKVTRRVLASAKHAPYRRILNGTPVSDSPFAAYTQCRFLDPNAWASLGVTTYGQFKVMFGIWQKYRLATGREFPKLIQHQNLDIMQKILLGMGSRVLKADVLDLPPKLYEKRHYDLSPDQRRMYKSLKAEYATEFGDGSEVTAELAIVRMTRLQQICSGYLPADDERKLRPIGDQAPRLSCLREVLEEVPGSAILYGKYDIDIDIMAQELGDACVTFDGRTSSEDRTAAKRAFQDRSKRFFVGKPSACGRGLTLTAATTVIYYNNSFVLDDRLQSEDRPHRIGQEHPVTYVDILARDSIDGYILEALRTKRDLSAVVTGDDLPAWT